MTTPKQLWKRWLDWWTFDRLTKGIIFAHFGIVSLFVYFLVFGVQDQRVVRAIWVANLLLFVRNYFHVRGARSLIRLPHQHVWETLEEHMQKAQTMGVNNVKIVITVSPENELMVEMFARESSPPSFVAKGGVS